MLKDAVLPILKSNLRLATRIRCLPFKWDEENGRIVQILDPVSKYCWKFGIILHGLYVIYQAFSIITTKSDLLPVEKFLAGIILILHFCWFGFRLDLEPDPTPIQMFNRIISGEGMSTSLQNYMII